MDDPGDHLPDHIAHPGARDFGRNGSYLVYRQLQQHVEKFWEFMEEQTRDTASEGKDKIWLASKMVGRWPSGAPLTLSPDQDNPKTVEASADEYFSFAKSDPEGLRCPYGAHVRRSNPRDCLFPSPKSSLHFSNLHRILRRGRPYTQEDQKGLHFLCLNTSITDQFEFIQHDWVNHPKFDGMLYADSDPVTGVQHLKNPKLTHTFTVQEEPVRRRYLGLPRFVDVRGSGYFFLPSREAIAYLATRKTKT